MSPITSQSFCEDPQRSCAYRKWSRIVASGSAPLPGPSVDGRLVDVHIGRKVGGDVICDPPIGQPVDPGECEDLQGRVTVDDRGQAGSVSATMFGHRHVTRRMSGLEQPCPRTASRGVNAACMTLISARAMSISVRLTGISCHGARGAGTTPRAEGCVSTRPGTTQPCRRPFRRGQAGR